MEQQDVIDLAVLGLVAENRGHSDDIHEYLQNKYNFDQNIGYKNCTSILLRFNNKDYIDRIERRAQLTNRTDGNVQDKMYVITKRGQSHLESLLRSPVEEIMGPTHRIHPLVKIRFLHHLPKIEQKEQLAQLEDRILHVRNQLIENDKQETESCKSIRYHKAVSNIQVLFLDECLNEIEDLCRSISVDEGHG